MAEPPGQMPAAAGGGHLRVSHADREHAIEMLKAAYVQGMLAKDELDARVGQALASRTHADLAAVNADLPTGLSPTGPARPPAPARRRPLARAAAKSGSCLVIAAAAWLVGGLFDPDNGPGPHPYQAWAGPLWILALVAVVTAVGILGDGLVTALDQRRSRRQLPPRPRPGGHALDGQRHGGPGHGPVPPSPRAGHADLEAHKPRQHRQHTPPRAGRAPRGARTAPGAA